MKPSPEEEAALTLKSLDAVEPAGVPEGLEEKLFARFELEIAELKKTATPKWFWMAASALLFFNTICALNYLRYDAADETESASSAGSETLFHGGTSWY
jgi:hypothetical protein